MENSCSNCIRCLLTSEESFQFPSFVIQIWGLFGVEDDTENMHNNTRRGSLQLRHDNNSNDCLASCSTLEFWHLFGQSFDMLVFCFLLFLMSQKTHKKNCCIVQGRKNVRIVLSEKKKTKWLLFSLFVTHITHQLLPPTSFFDLSCRNNLSPDVPIKADLQISTITNRQSDKIAYKSQTRRRKKRQHLFFKETKWNVLQELFACFYHSQFFSVVVHPVGCSYPANRSPPFSPDAGPPHPDGSEGLGAPHVPPKEMQSFIGQEHVLGVNTAALKKLTSKTFRFDIFSFFFWPLLCDDERLL